MAWQVVIYLYMLWAGIFCYTCYGLVSIYFAIHAMGWYILLYMLWAGKYLFCYTCYGLVSIYLSIHDILLTVDSFKPVPMASVKK